MKKVKHYSNEYPRPKSIAEIEDDIEFKQEVEKQLDCKVDKEGYDVYLKVFSASLSLIVVALSFFYIQIMDMKVMIKEIEINSKWLYDLRQEAGSDDKTLTLIKNYDSDNN